MKKYISAIIITILTFVSAGLLIFPSECKGLVDVIWIMFFGFITLSLLTIITLINIYKVWKQDSSFNYLPILSFISSILIISLIVYLNSEKFKSKRLITGIGEEYDLILRENKEYELIKKELDFSCSETGLYKISGDTILLTEHPGYNKTLFVNETFLIDHENNVLKRIYKDSVDINTDNYLRINENYAP